MKEALNHLVERIGGINPKSQKANKGCRLLYPYVDRLEEVLPDIHNILLKSLVQNKGKHP